MPWVYFNLGQIDPTIGRFTIQKLLFGLSEDRQRAIPSIFILMLQVMKHTIWVARCDFRSRDKQPVAHECLSKAIAKLGFVLHLLGRQCETAAQICAFEWQGSLGHFEGEELVFSF